MLKIKKIINSLFYYFLYKLLYYRKLNINISNIIDGKLFIKIKNGAKCYIGKGLCSDGPLYLKCEANSRISIGQNCYFNHNCSITSLESIEIGNNCMFGNNVTIVDHNHKMENNSICNNKFDTSKIKIGNNVWIGANTVILKGVTIEDNSVVAAGAVVNKNIGKNEIWAGVPAHYIKTTKIK